MSDAVNHPAHYNIGKIEVIEFITDQQLDYPTGNAVKYLCRAGRKDPSKEIEDLEKAIWYIRWRIEVLQAAKEGRPARRPNQLNQRTQKQNTTDDEKWASQLARERLLKQAEQNESVASETTELAEPLLGPEDPPIDVNEDAGGPRTVAEAMAEMSRQDIGAPGEHNK